MHAGLVEVKAHWHGRKASINFPTRRRGASTISWAAFTEKHSPRLG